MVTRGCEQIDMLGDELIITADDKKKMHGPLDHGVIQYHIEATKENHM